MNRPLKLLVIDDSEDGSQRMLAELGRGGFAPEARRVASREAMRAALRDEDWDIILCDRGERGFGAGAALKLACKEAPEIPFVIVSDRLPPARAARLLHVGARDHVAKAAPARLVPVVERELEEAATHARRRRAEREWGESAARLLAIAESAQDAIVMVDAESRISFWNRAAERILGYAPVEALGQPVHRLLTPERLREAARAGWERFARTGEGPLVGAITELAARHKDGAEIPIELSISRLKSKGRWSAVGVLRDISERKRAEERLRESEARFRGAFEHAAVGMALVAASGRFLDANPALCAFTGYGRGELLAMDFQTLTHPEDLEESLGFRQRLLDGAIDSFRLEKRFIHKSGKTIWGLLSVALVQGGGDAPLHTVALIEDITEHKRAEERLRESEERYARAIAGTSDGIWDWNVATDEVYVSPRYQELLGYEAGQLGPRGQSLRDLVHPDDRKRVRSAMRAHLKESAPYDIEIRMKKKDGSYLWFRSRGLAERDEKGRPTRMAGSIADISAQKAAEEDRSRLGRIIENSLTEIYVFDAETLRFRQVNAGARANLRYRLDELKALTPLDLKPEFSRESFEALLAPLREGRERQIGFETLHRRKDGTSYDVAVRIQLMAEESPPVFAAFIEDITERKRAQRSLRESEEKFAELAENIEEVFWITDSTGERVDYVSPAYRQIWGRDPARLYAGAETWIEGVHPQDRKAIARAFAHKAARGEFLETYRIRQPEGDIRWVRDRRFPVRNGGDEVGRIVGITEDITAVREAGEERRKNREQIHDGLLSTIHALAVTIEKRDPYTSGHQQRVAELAVAIGRELGLTLEQLEGLKLGAGIHDIGKIWIPSEILNRPGRLSEIERQLVQTHCRVGYDIIKDVAFPWPVAAMVLRHHERIDGSGYPDGLKGADIGIEAKILAVADVVEAISSHRPYRAARGIDAGLVEILENRGKLYEPSVVAACMTLFREKGYTLELPD